MLPRLTDTEFPYLKSQSLRGHKEAGAQEIIERQPLCVLFFSVVLDNGNFRINQFGNDHHVSVIAVIANGLRQQNIIFHTLPHT
jgi:hypothetical protein